MAATPEQLKRLEFLQKQINAYESDLRDLFFSSKTKEEKQRCLDFYQGSMHQDIVRGVLINGHPEWKDNGIALQFDLSGLTDPEHLPANAKQKLTLFIDCLKLCALELETELNGASSERSEKIKALKQGIGRSATQSGKEKDESGEEEKEEDDDEDEDEENILQPETLETHIKWIDDQVNKLRSGSDTEQEEALAALRANRHEYEEKIGQLIQHKSLIFLAQELQLDLNRAYLPVDAELNKDSAIETLQYAKYCAEYCRLMNKRLNMIYGLYWGGPSQTQERAKDARDCFDNENGLTEARRAARNELYALIENGSLGKKLKEEWKKNNERIEAVKSQLKPGRFSTLSAMTAQENWTAIKTILEDPAKLPNKTYTPSAATGGGILVSNIEPGAYTAEFKPDGSVEITGAHAYTKGLAAVLDVFTKAGIKAVDIDCPRKNGQLDDEAMYTVMKQAIEKGVAPVFKDGSNVIPGADTLKFILTQDGPTAGNELAEEYVQAILNSGDDSLRVGLIDSMENLTSQQKDDFKKRPHEQDPDIKKLATELVQKAQNDPEEDLESSQSEQEAAQSDPEEDSESSQSGQTVKKWQVQNPRAEPMVKGVDTRLPPVNLRSSPGASSSLPLPFFPTSAPSSGSAPTSADKEKEQKGQSPSV